ncbi:hypothetical protein GGS26DRAFT_7056 [Hypomontagnella submonticulosa]|nr:hypothetical protein GGS26DRAFT_7056 [Hypomontagnella submonticulosa]
MPAQSLAWECNHWRRFPWRASGAFIVVLVLFAAMAVVLHTSNNQEVSSWPSTQRPVPVSVLLAILVNVANLCLAVALGQGYTVSWWQEALKGAELSRLQFDLSVQHSLAAIMQPSRSFSRFLLAALIALVVSIADGPIVQRASTTGLLTLGPTDTAVTIFVSPDALPANFSSWSGYEYDLSLLTPVFSGVSKAYASNENIMLPYSGCGENDSCNVTMTAPGFETFCNESSMPYNYSSLSATNLKNNNLTTFQVDFAFGDQFTAAKYSTVNFTVLFKPDPTCVGKFVRRWCSMRLGTVEYPIIISNGTAVLQPWRPSLDESDQLGRYNATLNGYTNSDLFIYGTSGGTQSMLGGIVYVSESLYKSYASLGLLPKGGFAVNATGQAATNYLTSDISTYGDCTMTWEDPSFNIINTARELMFQSAITNSMANSSYSTPQQLSATNTRVVTAYQTRFEYLGISIALMLLEVAVILYLLWGWHGLGRDASLDAFEIGKALGAPLLQEASSNAAVGDILAFSGRKRIRYGEIVSSEAREERWSAAPQSSPGKFTSVDNNVGIHEIADDNIVSTGGRPGETYEKEQFIGEMPPSTGTPRLGFSEATNVHPVTPGKLYY